uniref:Uncharacterized protein n=1 Tax=Fagus sylvatica TaxID=28930 RepID=A0A2N9HJ03_FAGSY
MNPSNLALPVGPRLVVWLAQPWGSPCSGSRLVVACSAVGLVSLCGSLSRGARLAVGLVSLWLALPWVSSRCVARSAVGLALQWVSPRCDLQWVWWIGLCEWV